MSERACFVRAAGMACPVGLSWPAACAAMRAGIARKRFSGLYDDAGREIVTSRLEGVLGEEVPPGRRWLELLSYALTDLARGSALAGLGRPAVFIAVGGAALDLSSPCALAEVLSRALDMRIDPEDVHVLREGAYGGYVALERGRACVRAGRPSVVAAAESRVTARALLALSKKQRLLVEGHSDGVIAGEAAAAVLLTGERRQALGRIRGLGFAREPSSLDNDVPLRAEGLLAAARAALREAGLEAHELDFRVSDAAGESFYFKEQALLVSRLLRERKAEFPLWLPAEALGDTGAAAGLCGLLWAMAGWSRNYAPGPRAIGFAGDEAGGRAAVVLERAG
jgi:3-oxoacyl-[acyl-carrier-protein] synthase-1